MNYIIFGAGLWGEYAIRTLGIPRVKCFVDNNADKKEYWNKKVISFEELKSMDLSDTIVVIASDKYCNEMEKQLLTIPDVKYFIFNSHDLDSCEMPHYYLHKFYEGVSYSRLLAFHKIEQYKKITIYGINSRIPYLISEIALQNGYDCIVEIIVDNAVGTEQTIGVPVVSWKEASRDFDCFIINTDRTALGLDSVLQEIDEKKVSIIDLYYDADCVEPTFRHPELIKYKDIHKGKRCFLIGNGPSLRIEDLEKLHEHNEICIAFNKIYRAYNQTNWRANYIAMYDQNVIEDCLKELDKIQGELFVGDSYHYENPEDKTNNLQYFHCINSGRLYDNNKPKFSDDVERGFYEGYTVVYTFGMQMAAYMGFSEIYLIGVDNNYISSNIQHKDYFIENYFYEGELKKYIYPPQTERNEVAFQKAEEYSRKNGFRIYNATRGGKLEVFERVNFDDLF